MTGLPTSAVGRAKVVATFSKSGSVQKTVPDQAETIDFSLLKPGFTQKSEQSRSGGVGCKPHAS